MQAHSTLLIKSLPTLAQDDVGLAVTVLQRLLTLCHYLPNTAINGIFRWETDDAVRQLQHDNGLYEDGIVDLRTWSVLADLQSPLS